MDEDIIKAQNILSGSLINLLNKTFHYDSFIYKTSNERLSNLIKYFKNKERILSVISSGDQLLNSIVVGVKNIDCFDISTFPKYFFNLKKAAIQSLSKEEYLDFFFKTITTSEKYDDYYDKIREYLDNDDLQFWDSLFNYFDWIDIYNSLLFSHETFNINNVINENIYLKDNNYNELKKKIDKVNINCCTGDIMSLSNELFDEYDLIYLSNIIYYVDIKKYLDMIKNFKIKDNGYVLTYLYHDFDKKLLDDHYYFDNIENSEAKILVYKKTK